MNKAVCKILARQDDGKRVERRVEDSKTNMKNEKIKLRCQWEYKEEQVGGNLISVKTRINFLLGKKRMT